MQITWKNKKKTRLNVCHKNQTLTHCFLSFKIKLQFKISQFTFHSKGLEAARGARTGIKKF